MRRRRLSFEKWPAALYAIGDVHGCLLELLDIESQIVADSARYEGEKWIVMLGDYVDRGPQSAQVIDHLLQPSPAGFRRFCLVGNHETMMLEFLDGLLDLAWLDQGGLETLQSYGARFTDPAELAEAGPEATWPRIPVAHIRFLRELPICLTLPGWVFVHAGIRPGVTLEEQTDEDLVWIREPFLSAPLPGGLRVVHGHTPAREPIITPHRVCLDTQCFLTGRLTAARIAPEGEMVFLATNPRTINRGNR